jgi:hypothetical protein
MSEDYLGNLLEYAVEQGCDISPSIGFTFNPDSGVGIVATEEIKMDEVLLSVPYSQCISAANIRANPTLSVIFLDSPGLLDYPDEILALGLMHAICMANQNTAADTAEDDDAEHLISEEKCPWIAHVQTMPTCYDTTIFWSEEELNLLRGHSSYHLTNLLKRQMEVDFATIHKPIAANYPELFPGLIFEHYVWALSCVYSRAVDFDRLTATAGPKDGSGVIVTERIIPPLIDFANHHPRLGLNNDEEFYYRSRDVLKFDPINDQLQLIAGRSYSPSEQIYIIYGDYNNAKLLYTYGFVIPGGVLDPFRGVDVFLKVISSMTNAERKLAIVDKDEELTAHRAVYDFQGTVRHNGMIMPSLKRMARLLQADTDELSQIESNIKLLDGVITTGNEMRVNRSLRELFMTRARPEQAEDERRRLGEFLLSKDGIPSGSNKEFMALLVQCEDRDVLMQAVAALDEEYPD